MLQYLKIDPVLRTQKINEWNKPIWWPLGLLFLLLLLAILPPYRALRRREQQTVFGGTGPRPDSEQTS